jgi:hypothetical protein
MKKNNQFDGNNEQGGIAHINGMKKREISANLRE